MDVTGSGMLKGAFMAVASCVFVHAGFDFIALAGGPNLWEMLVNPLTDGMVSLFNATIASPAAAATMIPPPMGAESLIAPIENIIPAGCHTHLDGVIHCGADPAPLIEW